jgi:carbonic anhydrase/acetyltransferase-like protein (isoleucine patch superfamily)
VTIGVGSIIEIDVVAGDGCQVGAMSLVPKQHAAGRWDVVRRHSGAEVSTPESS